MKWKYWKYWKYRTPTRSHLMNLGASILIIAGVTILFFGTPIKPTPEEANRIWTIAVPFFVAAFFLYILDFFWKR